MVIQILAFGIAKEILGGSKVALEVDDFLDVNGLKAHLNKAYPALNDLKSYLIAVNNVYALPAQSLHSNDEIAIIPPVSGG